MTPVCSIRRRPRGIRTGRAQLDSGWTMKRCNALCPTMETICWWIASDFWYMCLFDMACSREKWSLPGNYQLLLAFLTSFSGCNSAFILLFLEPGHRITWVSALWVSIPVISWIILTMLQAFQIPRWRSALIPMTCDEGRSYDFYEVVFGRLS
jgi:hypothetical protein